MRWTPLRTLTCFYSLIGACLPLSANAADTAGIESGFTEEDIFIDIPQVFSVTRQTQKLTEVPAATTILSQSEIQASGARRIPDLLRLVPGMHSYSVTTNRATASYHGMSDDHPGRMEVMLNGHSVYLPLLSTVAWETIGLSVEDIDYIEVVRGSNAPAYGSNAFLGAINIVTKNPLTESGTKLIATGGSLHTQEYFASHSESLNSLSYRLSANYNENDGADTYNDSAHNSAINLSGTYTPTVTDTVDFNFGFSRGSVELGQADDLDNNFTPRKHDANYQHIRWNRVLDKNNDLKVSFTHNYLDLEEVFTSAADALVFFGENPAFAGFLAPIQPLGTEHGTMNLYDIEAEHNLRINPTLSAVWGVGYRFEEAESATLLQNQGEVTEEKWRLFGNLQWKPTAATTVNAGGLFESTSISENHFSPRLAVNYNLSQSSALRASATLAYRTPSLLAKNSASGYLGSVASGYEYFDLITTPNYDLDPEKLTSYELGFFKQWPKSNSHLDIRVFTEHISNGVNSYYFADNGNDYDLLNDGFRISDNIATWRNMGAEFQFKYQPVRHFYVLTNYSYLNQKGQRDRGSRGIDTLDERTPLHTASMLMRWDVNEQLWMGLSQYYMTDVNWLEGGQRDEFHRTDFNISKTFKLKGASELSTRLIVENLFNDAYSEFYEHNLYDRRAYLQFQLSL
ncbi:TonB-dependent receptor plug domain-containing protein [Neptuniibacter halophilus]|uniref:TonB-dependent receptor plug domain-containing protein n=1 Tax=Neptuniibacter halophilus TaxID=651666 RepID=UPI0025740466|nr:TonB-dependent receptor [Neptuniibacter halophilus]